MNLLDKRNLMIPLALVVLVVFFFEDNHPDPRSVDTDIRLATAALDQFIKNDCTNNLRNTSCSSSFSVMQKSLAAIPSGERPFAIRATVDQCQVAMALLSYENPTDPLPCISNGFAIK